MCPIPEGEECHKYTCTGYQYTIHDSQNIGEVNKSRQDLHQTFNSSENFTNDLIPNKKVA